MNLEKIESIELAVIALTERVLARRAADFTLTPRVHVDDGDEELAAEELAAEKDGQDCPTCDGGGKIRNGTTDCPACGGTGEKE